MSGKTVAKWTVGLVLGLVIGQVARAEPVGSEFTYHGFLEDGPRAVTDTCDFDFSLWDAESGGTPVGATDSHLGVNVENGLFTVLLEFDEGVFAGQALWLEVSVECTNDTMPQTLAPRQKLTPSGYAHGLRHLYTEQIPDGNDPSIVRAVNVVGGIAVVGADVQGATISGGGLQGIDPVLLDPFYRPNTVSANLATIGGGANNTASDAYATIGGGDRNTASGFSATVGGGAHNTAGHNATVSGGSNNTASGTWATSGGGSGNTASGTQSTIGGGVYNTASNNETTIGGGQKNIASGFRSTVGGGAWNTASGPNSTVCGGGGFFGGDPLSNTASGGASMVPGGQLNVAGGDFSFAAGRRAKVRDAAATGDGDGDEGTFVWADSTDADFASTGRDQFLIRATGGVGIGTASPDAPLHVVGGSDTSASGGGHLVLGPTSGTNLSIDGNEIMARVNGQLGTLYLNAGGMTRVSNVDADGTIHADGRISSGNGLQTLGGPSYNQARFESGNPGGTWLNLENTDTDGRDFALVSTGSANTEGAGSLLFRDNFAAAVRMMIDDNGNVGVGTTLPEVPLHVNGGTDTSESGGGYLVLGPTTAVNMSIDNNEIMVRNNGSVATLHLNAGGTTRATNLETTGTIISLGNVGIGTTSPGHPLEMASGAHVTAGGVWTDACSRDWKENFTPADGREMLDKVAALPIAAWNYKSEDDSTRHVGPVAEDFHALFGTGADDKHLAALDSAGVALAAIQGLYEIVQEKERSLRDMHARNQDLEARVAALERMIKKSTGVRDPK